AAAPCRDPRPEPEWNHARRVRSRSGRVQGRGRRVRGIRRVRGSRRIRQGARGRTGKRWHARLRLDEAASGHSRLRESRALLPSVKRARQPFDLRPILKGDRITLRPMKPEDFDAVFAAGSDPLIWEQHPERDRYTEARFRAYFQDGLNSGGALV